MNQDPFIELIENFLESECSTDFSQGAFQAVPSLTDEQISLFYSQLNDVDRAQHEVMVSRAPTKEDEENKSQSPQLGRPYSAMFTHPYNGLETPSLDELKRQLLFFNKVAVVVPEAKTFGKDIAQKRQDFEKLLNSYFKLLPLVKQGSIELLPMSGFYSNEIEGGAGIIRLACEDDEVVSSWINANKSYADDFAIGARSGDPYFDAGIRIASAVSYGHQLAATHPFVGGLYCKLLGENTQTPDLSQVELLRNMDKIHLPGLSGLDWEDIVSIRNNEDALEEWRVNLNAAVTSVDPYLPPDQFVERFNAQVPAQLAQAARQLDGKLGKNTSMARFKKGFSEVFISGVAAVVTGNPLGPIEKLWEGVRTVLEAEGAKQALHFFWASRERNSGNALKSHYAVFRTPPSDR